MKLLSFLLEIRIEGRERKLNFLIYLINLVFIVFVKKE